MVNLTKSKRKEATGGVSPPSVETKGGEKRFIYDRQAKTFFLTQNNPADYGLDREKVIEIVHKTFRKNNLIYWAYVEEEGSCRHFHLYCILGKKKRWSAVQKAFPHAHMESEVKGSPQQNRAYLLKEGDKHKDKAETQIEGSFYEEGELPDFFVSNDRTEMLIQIENMLDSGMTPNEIMEKSLVFRQYESLIRKHFFARRFAETPPIREIKVTWHLGSSGSGKSYTYVKLCGRFGADRVYYASDFTNACSSLLDTYTAEPYLFLDEVKTDSFKFGYLLQLLQGYRTPIHARYSNVYSLWKEVHITSIFTPREVYEEMVGVGQRSTDSFYQLERRITNYVYHWKTDDGVYHEYEIPASEFTSYEELKRRAEGTDGFTSAEGVDIPFED